MKGLEQKIIKERKQHPTEMLRNMLTSQAAQTNEIVRKEYQIRRLLMPSATIDPRGYIGLYGKEAVESDADFVRNQEIAFSNASNPRVQAFYRDEFGVQTEDEIIEKWRTNKTLEKNGQMEMAITLLLSQKLGREFIVVRTAPYDDYENGGDNLILDLVTGEVVGAFDEVHEGGDGRRTEEKKTKVEKIAKQGGARIKYGIKLENKKLIRAGLEGVPVFYLGLESSELSELIQGLTDSNSESIDKIFDKLISSLQSQFVLLVNNSSDIGFRTKLHSFGKALTRVINRDKEEESKAA